MSSINPVKPDFFYSFRSLVSAPASALEVKKVFLGFLALLGALLVYDVFVYLAVALDGLSMTYFFRDHGFFPLELIKLVTRPAQALYFLGIGLALFVIMVGFLAISAITIEELRGNRLFSASQGLRFALSRSKQMFFSLLATAAFAAVLLSLIAILGAVARLPWIGDSAFALLFILPGYPLSMLVVFVSLVLCGMFFILPAVTASDRIGETFTSLLESFSTLLRQPFRWLGYTAYTLVAGKVCLWVLALFSVAAVRVFVKVGAFSGGQEVERVFRSASALLPLKAKLVTCTTFLCPQLSDWLGVNPGMDISSWARSGASGISVYLMAIALVAVFLYVWGYGVSIIATGQAYAYVIIKKLRDDYEIPAEDPLFPQEEWINPPIDETPDGESESASSNTGTNTETNAGDNK